MSGMDELAHYTHAVEGILDEVRKGSLTMTSALVSLLLEALDCIKGFMAEAVGEGTLDRGAVSDSHSKIIASMGREPAAPSTAMSAKPPEAVPPPAAVPLHAAVPEPAVTPAPGTTPAETPFIIQVHARPDFFPQLSELETVSRSLGRLGGLIAISHEHSLPSEDRRQGEAWRRAAPACNRYALPCGPAGKRRRPNNKRSGAPTDRASAIAYIPPSIRPSA